MKQTITRLAAMLSLALLTAGCATSRGYPKAPPPCDDFAASFNAAADDDCGPKRAINR